MTDGQKSNIRFRFTHLISHNSTVGKVEYFFARFSEMDPPHLYNVKN